MAVIRLVTVKRVPNTSHLIIVGRADEGKSILLVTDFRPYFYVLDESGRYKTNDGRRARRIYTSKPEDVKRLRDRYPVTYEADIPYTRRFLIDTGIRSCFESPVSEGEVSYKKLKPSGRCLQSLRVGWIDVELAGGERIGEGDLVSVSLMTGDRLWTVAIGAKERQGRWTVVKAVDEEDVVVKTLTQVERMDLDVLSGWNVYFDYDVMRRKVSSVLGMEWEPNVAVFDLLEAYRIVAGYGDNRLKEVALREGLIPKVVYTGADVNTLWREERYDEIAKYNAIDVAVLPKIDSKYGLFDLFTRLKDIVGLPNYRDAMKNSVLIDTLLLREARLSGVVLPTKAKHEKRGYEGAIVFEPPVGIFEGVAIFDMSRYYPSIILTFNISPDGLGLVPHIVRKLLEEREILEEELAKTEPGSPLFNALKKRRNAVKYLVNAVYGFLAYSESRIFDERSAAMITEKAREGLLVVKELAENMDYRVLYGDTDSIMIQVPFEDVEGVLEELNKGIRTYFKEKYGVETKMRLKFERYLSKVMFIGVKKKYAGIVVWEGKPCNYLYVKGFEVVRSDQSPFAQKLQKELIRLILEGAGKEEVREFIKEKLKEMRSLPLEEVAIRKRVTKDFDSYRVKPAHVRAAVLSNLYLGTSFQPGDVIKMLYVKRVDGLPRTDVIAFDHEERLPSLEVDWDRMIEASVRGKLDPILKVVGLTFDSISSESLEGWI